MSQNISSKWRLHSIIECALLVKSSKQVVYILLMFYQFREFTDILFLVSIKKLRVAKWMNDIIGQHPISLVLNFLCVFSECYTSTVTHVLNHSYTLLVIS